ncbi:hypothetical protein EYF80_057108 [Liparis tanakae]|uniref:Uncharacterized protein n=1 Tax=Liparis tanakae TaxID=230148 RepID=A0A4Z2EV65_9TELE|nr:hypothetical protein EYF80_057108 [Liparis tanakae]
MDPTASPPVPSLLSTGDLEEGVPEAPGAVCIGGQILPKTRIREETRILGWAQPDPGVPMEVGINPRPSRGLQPIIEDPVELRVGGKNVGRRGGVFGRAQGRGFWLPSGFPKAILDVIPDTVPETQLTGSSPVELGSSMESLCIEEGTPPRASAEITPPPTPVLGGPGGRTYAQVVAQGEPRSWTYQVGLTGSGGPGRVGIPGVPNKVPGARSQEGVKKYKRKTDSRSLSL